MKRISLFVLAVAALCAIAIHPASALTGTGWHTAIISSLTVGEDVITYVVSTPPHIPTGQAISGHNTTFTRHVASILCRANAWPNLVTQKDGPWIYSATIGGPSNNSVTGACAAGRTFQQGGAWIDEVW